MCFYDNYKFLCGDYKWGVMRQQCTKEYRIGETCGMRMIYQTIMCDSECTWCEKIAKKRRRLEKLTSDIKRWAPMHDRKHSRERAIEEYNEVMSEMRRLQQELQTRRMTLTIPRRAS
ncbi:Hypothetical protein R9X50_00546100 [Acrodontium crateriforme]|uniref:Uncharacterized protein n=1 Tax=Acrodontium crateriforme TaxID=150365 RepID=A0AAQ3RAW2_9PEZI|nr:Hypothetical protein R9X50_00546100 [Acrodontium crateriforme]